MKFYKFLGICLILCLISLSAVYADDEVINSSDSSIEDSNFDVIDEEDYSSSFDSSNDVIDKNVSEKIYFFDENNESIGYIVFYNDNLSLPNILVNGVKSNQDTIVVNDFTKYYGASDRLVATFYNADGTLLRNSNVGITINGQTYIKLTNDVGVVSMGINLNSGIYTATFSNFNTGYSKNVTVTILHTVIGNDLVKYYKNASQYQVVILNTNGTPTSSNNVIFNINGVYYNCSSNSNGVASLNINLPPGTYIITVKNPVSNEFHSNKIIVLPIIYVNNLTKYYNGENYFYVHIVDGQGNPLPNTPFTINYNGQIFNLMSNNNGLSVINTNDNGLFTASYNGCNFAFSSNIYNRVVAFNTTVTYGAGEKLMAKALDSKGNAATSGNITFNINGVGYNKSVNERGIAAITINLPTGDYMIKFTYEGNTISRVLHVVSGSHSPNVDLDTVNPVYIEPDLYNIRSYPITKYALNNTDFKLKLIQDNGLPLSDKKIIFVVDFNTVYEVYTDNQGVASFNIDLNDGLHSIFYYYSFNAEYFILNVTSSSGLDSVLSSNTNAIWNNGYFNVTLQDNNGNPINNSEIEFVINGNKVVSNTNDEGVASIRIIGGARVYPVVVNFAGSDVYNPSSLYKIFYLANNNTDKVFTNKVIHYGNLNYTVTVDDWINPANYHNFYNYPLDDVIADTSSSQLVSLANELCCFDDYLENIISLNTYVSGINYSYYLGHNQSAIETICNFSGNCVDQTNVFISLARIKNIPVAYISGSPINGTVGHMWAQVIVDNILVTIDNSAVGHDNSYLGDKDYLATNLNIDYYIFNCYSNNNAIVFHDYEEYIFY